MLKVSVIIPAYNQGQYLGQAIESVLGQTYQNFEIVVVDDGSTDDTRHVAQAQTDLRVHYIYQTNQGLSAARNTGIRHASGDVIALLDSDDLYLPEKLARSVEILHKYPEIGFVAGQTILMSADGRPLRTADMQTPTDGESLLLGNPFHPGGVLFYRRWLDQVGLFDETLRACEDWDMWLRLALVGCRMRALEQPVTLYRVHTAQMTRDALRMRTAMLTVLDKTFSIPELPAPWRDLRAQAYAQAYVKAAAREYRADMFEEAQRDLAEAVRLDPALMAARGARLVEMLVGWAESPQFSDAEGYLRRVYGHLPPELACLRPEVRRAIAASTLRPLFRSARPLRQARRMSLARAIYYDPAWLFNRGVLRMLADAWLPAAML